MPDAEEQATLVSPKTFAVSPDTITKLVMRLRAMTFKLLPVEVELASISEPSSRIITQDVIKAYQMAAGDFDAALPYCLINARQTFIRDANRNPADYDENMGRATACEVLARRIMHTVEPDRMMSIMSTRYRYREDDGDPSSASSVLEAAIDSHCTIFLSSSEAQHVVNALWRGDWIQRLKANYDIEYVPYHDIQTPGFFGHLDPQRLSVPRYQNALRVYIWLVFLFVYSQAVQQPLEQLDPSHHFDAWEGALYTMALAYSAEEMHMLYKTLRYFTWRAFGFWTIISIITDSLLVTAFTLRMAGIVVVDEPRSDAYHLLSFRFLSCVAPFIWAKLLTVVDGYKYIGTMQICVARMLRESTIFFALLSILLVGFAQGMYALDASDGNSDGGSRVFSTLLEALLQAPDFTNLNGGIFGTVMFYMWMVASTIILLNVLISLFASAYSDVVDDAEAQFSAFFAAKTVALIRAPDAFVFPAPFSLIEMFFVAPFELCLPPSKYASLSGAVMMVVFFLPLSLISMFELRLEKRTPRFMRSWMHDLEAHDDSSDEHGDPEVEDEGEYKISKVKFAELVKKFPNTSMSSEASLMREMLAIQKRMDQLLLKLETRRVVDSQ